MKSPCRSCPIDCTAVTQLKESGHRRGQNIRIATHQRARARRVRPVAAGRLDRRDGTGRRAIAMVRGPEVALVPCRSLLRRSRGAGELAPRIRRARRGRTRVGSSCGRVERLALAQCDVESHPAQNPGRARFRFNRTPGKMMPCVVERANEDERASHVAQFLALPVQDQTADATIETKVMPRRNPPAAFAR